MINFIMIVINIFNMISIVIVIIIIIVRSITLLIFFHFVSKVNEMSRLISWGNFSQMYLLFTMLEVQKLIKEDFS